MVENHKSPDTLVFVMRMPEGTVESVRRYEKIVGQKFRVLLLVDAKLKQNLGPDQAAKADLVVEVDFTKPEKIAEALLPYQDQLLAITCRGEAHIARFAAVIPHVPYLRTPSTESLRWASDKYEMRKRMKLYDPAITPKFTLVHENSKKERQRVIEKIGFPMIIKPTNLSGSLLVSVCYHEEDLEKTIRKTFAKLKRAYDQDNRLEKPKLIAEVFMDGDMYSIDSYVSARGKVEHCPLVKVVTGKKIGHDDFYGYLQITPTTLKRETVAKAEATAKKAIHALGLRSTITHIELMRIDDEWKVVEVAARMGGFRHVLYQLTCGIDHALNDILIRIPHQRSIPKKCTGYACAMKWFAPKEGKIKEMKGIKKIELLRSFHSITVNKKIGDKAAFACHGGRSIFNLFLKNSDRAKLLADIRRVEQIVDIKIE